MNDTSTSTPLSADAEGDAGHGKHRGSGSSQDESAAPHGRHRKPAQQADTGA